MRREHSSRDLNKEEPRPHGGLGWGEFPAEETAGAKAPGEQKLAGVNEV